MAAGLLELPIPPKKHRSPVSLCPCWINAWKDWAGRCMQSCPESGRRKMQACHPSSISFQEQGDAPHGTVAIPRNCATVKVRTRTVARTHAIARARSGITSRARAIIGHSSAMERTSIFVPYSRAGEVWAMATAASRLSTARRR